jgi:putative flippase GtrA
MAMSRLLRFGIVGVLGYVVDAGVLLVATQLLDVQYLLARVASFLIAASVTFLIHHRFTFRLTTPLSAQRWSYYLLTTGVGALVNVGIYHLWVVRFGVEPMQLALGAAVGSIVAMFVNYFASSVLVFRQPRMDKPVL